MRLMQKKIYKIGDVVILRRVYKGKIDKLYMRGIIKSVNINNGLPLYKLIIPGICTVNKKMVEIIVDNHDIWRIA